MAKGLEDYCHNFQFYYQLTMDTINAHLFNAAFCAGFDPEERPGSLAKKTNMTKRSLSRLLGDRKKIPFDKVVKFLFDLGFHLDFEIKPIEGRRRVFSRAWKSFETNPMVNAEIEVLWPANAVGVCDYLGQMKGVHLVRNVWCEIVEVPEHAKWAYAKDHAFYKEADS